MECVRVHEGGFLQNKQGRFNYSSIIGKKYGAKIHSQNGERFLFVLRFTPELWSLVLPHRTQIIYHADISFILAQLSVLPGASVIESGTGSGSFSHSLSRAIGPAGKLYTYEFHEERALKAQDEFKLHGIQNISILHSDVCENGFGLYDSVDAVFLDLPAPWKAIQHAKQSMKVVCC